MRFEMYLPFLIYNSIQNKTDVITTEDLNKRIIQLETENELLKISIQNSFTNSVNTQFHIAVDFMPVPIGLTVGEKIAFVNAWFI